MKKNLPVDSIELFLLPHRPIVTKTDLKGQITYANRAFIDISGFSEEELIGQSHNVVRHPDMPEEAFADLWDTIKSGRPWKGLVKNRSKQGHFYWVEAYVTPICENGRPVGYMSVRRAVGWAKLAKPNVYREKHDDFYEWNLFVLGKRWASFYSAQPTALLLLFVILGVVHSILFRRQNLNQNSQGRLCLLGRSHDRSLV
ncbi:PAS domain-containing protein [Chromobacterium vaccinii]|uniref:PAS domain-containing protein n=1 Tax=Chromobacterium vaccinii TaxID=1108595 RepID=UPI00061814B4|nr:PAS domain-containing protein [Chromobacterium vaccinii]